jgi:inner membrane transporter RhtA
MASTTETGRLTRRPSLAAVPAPLLILCGVSFVNVGSSLAKSLFDELSPHGVVFLRLATAAVVFLAVRRPSLRGHSRRDLLLIFVFGANLAAMNNAFYEAISRLPVGITVTIEFAFPLTLAVITSKRRRDLIWIALAAGGIVLLAEGGGHSLNTLGVVLACVTGFLWACFIVIGTRVAKVFPGGDGLALAVGLACVLATPSGIATSGSKLLDPELIAIAAGVGVLSSVIPWTVELEALRRIPTHVFSVLMSLEPAVAALAGFAVLGETLSGRQIAAIGLVVVASIGVSIPQKPALPPDP